MIQVTKEYLNFLNEYIKNRHPEHIKLFDSYKIDSVEVSEINDMDYTIIYFKGNISIVIAKAYKEFKNTRNPNNIT